MELEGNEGVRHTAKERIGRTLRGQVHLANPLLDVRGSRCHQTAGKLCQELTSQADAKQRCTGSKRRSHEGPDSFQMGETRRLVYPHHPAEDDHAAKLRVVGERLLPITGDGTEGAPGAGEQLQTDTRRAEWVILNDDEHGEPFPAT